MDSTVVALLKYCKGVDYEPDWRPVRDKVLANLYHSDMRLIDVVKVLLTAYEQMLMEPRFELPGRHAAAEDLILAPVVGSDSIELHGPKNGLDTLYSVEQFYGAIVRRMLTGIRLARIDWCRHDLGMPVRHAPSLTAVAASPAVR